MVGGLTVVIVTKLEAYLAYRASQRIAGAGPVDWRNPNNDFAAVDLAPSQVQILPTKFRNVPNSTSLKGSPDGLKWIGINVPLRVVAWVAYDSRPARLVFETSPPTNRFDFITTLPDHALEALQQELGTTLGWSGRRESRETDVLLLKVRTPNSRGLRTATLRGTQNWRQEGRYYCDDVPLLSTNRALQGLSAFLEQVFNRPVIDQTGLTQHFNIDLRWDAREPSQRDAVRKALLEQLGLEFVSGRQTLDMLVMTKTN